MELKKSFSADLENKKSVYFLSGIAIGLCLILVAFEWKVYEVLETTTSSGQSAVVDEELVPITRMENLPPPPPPPPQQLELEIVEDDEEVADVDIKTSEADDNTKYDIKAIDVDVEEVVEAAPEIFTIVEESPEFPGGVQKLYEFIGNNIKYPQMARENGIQGKVFVKFVVWKDGSIRDVQVARGIGGGCDEEAVRVVKAMPSWKPGKQRNQAVPVYFNLPISFNLR